MLIAQRIVAQAIDCVHIIWIQSQDSMKGIYSLLMNTQRQEHFGAPLK
jgi:hypothetical protein